MVGTADLSGKTCIVTGASNGIGKATAAALAAMGARVVMVCRDAARAEAARAEIARDAATDDIDVLIADLSSQEQVRGLASQISSRYPKIDVLLNNAGAINTVRTTTVDGLETTFAVNHLAYFLLTNLLLDQVRASGAGARGQRQLRGARRRADRFRRPAGREALRRDAGVRAVEAGERAVHLRAGAAAGGQRRDGQLPASGRCGDGIRAQQPGAVQDGA